MTVQLSNAALQFPKATWKAVQYGLSHQENVVVDGFGDSNDCTRHPCPLALMLDGIGARIAAVAADDKHHVQGPHVDPLHDLLDVRPSPATPGTMDEA